MSISKWLIVLSCFFGAQTLNAQYNSLQFENYDFRAGLSQNSGYAITQDKTGFMWFGTQDGLNRFDGYEMKVFRKSLTPNSIPDNFISALATDDDGNIWIGTPNGLSVYYALSNKVEKLADSAGSGNLLSHCSIIGIKKDSHNNIWILTQFDGVFLFTHQRQLISVKNSQNIVSFCEDDNNKLRRLG